MTGVLLAGASSAVSSPLPRLLVLTDISSLTAGVREPDDGQSMIRLMLYTNDLEIEGLIASSNLGHGQVVRPELIREVVDAYEKVRPSLLLHHPGYPTAAHLRERIKAGQPVADRQVEVLDSIGAGKDTEASDWIIRVVDKPDPRPVWIAIWGGSADLAQALWKVQKTRSPADLAAFLGRIRVHSIGDQDSTGPWIKRTFPALHYLTRDRGIRGMYRGGNTSLVSSEWVEANIRSGHGPLGALYPNYNGGDIWSSRLGRVRGIKEGDTPSILAFFPAGLADPDEPTWGTWGGRFIPTDEGPHRLTDARDDVPGSEGDPDPRMSAVWRWRPAFQADFAARLDWCVKPYADANHPPLARVAGPLRRTVRPGETVTLDARASTDPDGDRLTYSWTFYREPSTYTGPLTIEDHTAPLARVVMPRVSAPRTIHLLLTVTDDGSPALSAYQRIVLKVAP